MQADLELLRQRLREELDFVLLAPTYPRLWKHGGEFIRSRVHAYAESGLRGMVIDYSAPATSRVSISEEPSGPIVHVGPDLLHDVVTAVAAGTYPVLVHSPTPELQHQLVDSVPGSRTAVWFHGYEVRDHRRLFHNHDTQEAALLRESRDKVNVSRFTAARKLFNHPGLTVVFVSDFQRRVSEHDVGAPAPRAEVIPNFIDGEIYSGRVRRPDEVRKILLMRSFKARNYGNDIAVEALRQLTTRDGFSDLEITVRGFGRHFEETVAPLRHIQNIEIQERYSSPAEMAAMHFDNGVFLCATRWDTQGVMLGEAMSSGMVPVTTPVAAIPEFTGSDAALMANPDDPRAFAAALWHLVENPSLMPVVSQAAITRVEEKCGRAATVDKEIALIGRLAT